ncbi:MAG: glycosyltransferase [Alphaproteobacteria bacterium]|nr:glycosyltransferase [Alphaproteobacteria bacterium]
MKIGIVTAYDEGEANSEYSKVLKEEFERQGHSVEILRLPFSVFTVSSRPTQKLADVLIDEMVEKIKHLDYVNIQYETQLFGCDCYSVFRRIKKILLSCKPNHFSITMHSQIWFDTKNLKENIYKRCLHTLIKKKKWFSHKNLDRLIYRILNLVSSREGLIITHTMRAQERVKAFFPNANTKAFPLCYKRYEDIKNIKNSFNKEKYMQEKGIVLNKNEKAIGVLGAFTHWKDLDTCVMALSILPKEYHLFFYGGMHKLEFKHFPNGLDRIKELEKKILSLNLQNRVHFMGFQPTSEDFFNAHLFCDYIVLPYLEVGEDGSGSASVALETNDNVFLTRNCTFDELKLFTGEAAFNFDMGNYLELAEKIKNLPDKHRILEQRKKYFKHYNVTENVKIYLSIMD